MLGIYIGGGMQISAPTECAEFVSIQTVFIRFLGRPHFDRAGDSRHA